VECAVGPSILVFLVGVVAVGIAGAVYKANQGQSGYQDDDDVGE
jgi:hypothetical protein